MVDDEVALGQMMQALLAEHNYTAVVVDGPATALSAFTRGEKFDLALVNLNMPVMDGGRLAKAIRNINPALRVILVTGSQEVMREQSKTSQFAAVVAKPFTAETLLVALDKALHG